MNYLRCYLKVEKLKSTGKKYLSIVTEDGVVIGRQRAVSATTEVDEFATASVTIYLDGVIDDGNVAELSP